MTVLRDTFSTAAVSVVQSAEVAQLDDLTPPTIDLADTRQRII
jgi:hypothetical protein